ncbi:MAG: hypothetical protein AAF614_27650 [Chloroflexota bacterium]
MLKRLKSYTLLLLSLFVVACNIAPPSTTPPLPTQAATAAIPTNEPATPIATTLPPTLDFSELEPTSLPPTEVAPTAAAAHEEEPAANTPTPEPLGPATIKITDPTDELTVPMSTTLTIRGLASLSAGQGISVTLAAMNGRVLTATTAIVEDSFWQANLRVPEFVSGSASLTAVITDDSETIYASETLPVTITLDKTASDRYLEILRPQEEAIVAGGFNLFADGNAERPVGGQISMSVWADDCQRQVSSQGYELRGSGYWQAFLVLPPDAVGPACAIIWFGTPGEETWREHQTPITLLAADDAEAKGVVIGFPPPDSLVTAGQDLFLHGTAQNAQLAPVRVSILLENGRIISESDIQTDFWGYWQQTIFLPIDVVGPAQITVTVGESGDSFFAQSTTNITIEEAPPTPVP